MSNLDQQAKAALKRLNADWKDIQLSPILGVSAAPLEKDVFEWHCNFEFESTIYHVILYFPKTYPAKSPSAEFISGIEFSGATKRGPKGGTQVCLSIFSDFAMVHDEWANEKGTGWSPSYTVQTVLLNLLSFLVETSSGRAYYAYGASSKSGTVAAARAYVCPDCGHTHAKPFPPLPTSTEISKVPQFSEITCYVTRLNITDAKNEIFGFGIVQPENPKNPNYSSPCEYITAEGFESLKQTGKVESVMRDEIHYFMPLYVNPTHANNIAPLFENSLYQIAGGGSYEKRILNVLPKLMNSAVLSFMNGKTHASERALHGYFAFHRLFMWACSTYGLVPIIEEKVRDFLDDPRVRLKRNTPNIGDWLTYLTVAPHTRWNDVATTFLQENFLRNVMWYVKEKPALANTRDSSVDRTRVEDTFRLTKVSRDLIAFQVLFLDVARPSNMSIEQVAARYDENNGLPTAAMMAQMGEVVARIKKGIRNFDEFFDVIKVPRPSTNDLIEMLKESVALAGKTDGYYTRGGANYGSDARTGGESAWEKLKKRAREEAGEDKREAKAVKVDVKEKEKGKAAEEDKRKSKDNDGKSCPQEETRSETEDRKDAKREKREKRKDDDREDRYKEEREGKRDSKHEKRYDDRDDRKSDRDHDIERKDRDYDRHDRDYDRERKDRDYDRYDKKDYERDERKDRRDHHGDERKDRNQHREYERKDRDHDKYERKDRRDYDRDDKRDRRDYDKEDRRDKRDYYDKDRRDKR